ncbi:MAG: cohesin domain-containing protein [Chloroflexota bacterium]
MNALTLRKYVPILLIMTLLAGLFGLPGKSAVAAPGDIVFSWSLPSGQINPGQNFSVPLLIDVRSGVPLSGGQFDISYNPAVVRLNSVTWGTFFPANCPSGAIPFFNNPTIDNTVGIARNVAFAGLAVPSGQGCTGSGTVATLNFTAVAAGLSSMTISGVIMAYGTSAAPAGDITFPGFNQYVGAAPRLVVQDVSFSPATGDPSGFTVHVTVANTGGVDSPADVPLLVTTDGNATPASQIVQLAPLAGGASRVVDLTGYQLAAGQSSAVVTAAIAAFSSSASSSYSLASSAGETRLDATFGAFIQITPDALVNFGRLQLGVNERPGSINVKCNTNWQVDVSDRNPTAWRMSEYDGSSFVPNPRRLIEPLSVTGQGRTVTVGTPPFLLSGNVAGQSGDAGQDFALTYSQRLRYADPLLPAGRSYHLVLTFNGFVTQ